MTPTIACIVEGHGEVEAVPVLIRRLAQILGFAAGLHVPPPFRAHRNRLQKAGELERAVELAARKAGISGGILVLLDADEDCPATLGPELLRRAQAVRRNLPISVVLAKREFESWFLTAAESLAGQRGLSASLSAPPDPESVSGAKEWLSQRMPPARSYRETLDQPAFTARFDLQAARNSDSFDKCFREIERLLTELQTADGP